MKWLWPHNHDQIIDKLIEEGRRVGKAPWYCSMLVEDEAAERLLYGHGITGRETMNETVARREQEKHGS